MSKPSTSPLSSFVRVTTLILVVGLVLALAVNASAGTGLIDSIASFFSTADTNAVSTTAPEPVEDMITPGTCDTAGPIEVESSGGTLAGVPTAYTSLTNAAGAFLAINGGTLHLGTITIDVCGNSTSEAGTNSLNQVAGVTSITMSPAGGAARTISGAPAAGTPLINLNGADNVTIDGLNTSGNSLTISNTFSSSTAGTSTIRFIADASNNLVTRATILGASVSTSATLAATIVFAAGTTTGNDNNTISNCEIGPTGGPNLPSKAIHGGGTSAIENDNVQITGITSLTIFLPTRPITASICEPAAKAGRYQIIDFTRQARD